jgi:UDP-N-acetylmuramate dehydrogenase
LRIIPNYSLKSYNTFGIDVKAKFFTEIAEERDLPWLVSLPEFKDYPWLILGGGSNILFTKDFPGLVAMNRIRGIAFEEVDDQSILVTAGAGVNWHDLVLFTIDHGWGGLENLSLIPGTVGAAPIQNIGAYGVELKDVFTELEAFEIATQQMRTFSKEACEFGYRNSIFKNALKHKFIITRVTFKLNKQPKINASYGAISAVLEANGVSSPGIREVSDAVISTRQQKLPDPKEIGNSGSFFKNPVVEAVTLKTLQEEYPDIPSYDISGGQFKIPAAWLIDSCGWKGHRRETIGVHDKQPLVLVNFGDGTGDAVKALALEIQASVKTKFGILLTPEVNII